MLISFRQVRRTFNKEEGISWSKAMDKVRVARLVRRYKEKESKDEYDPLLVLIKQWPKANKYQRKAELVEPQVKLKKKILNIVLFTK